MCIKIDVKNNKKQINIKGVDKMDFGSIEEFYAQLQRDTIKQLESIADMAPPFCDFTAAR